MEHPAIRIASDGDGPLLAELGATTFTETFANDNSPEDMAAYLAEAFNVGRLREELADPDATFFIAEVDDVAAGYAKLRAGETTEVEGETPIELVRLYVLRDWLGRGVGPALMEACLEHARRAGHRTIWLGVWERNWRAQAFYRKWGFVEAGDHVFQVGSDAQRDLLMVRAV
jgi:ribosomal protein S18 acetylase RimI-like enzyme